jgi:stage II sporulation protein R
MKKFSYFTVFFCIGIIIASLIYLSVIVFETDGIYSGVIRLHVLANSDNEDDQTLKLSVRDALLEYFGDSDDAKNLDDATRFILENKDEIERVAEERIKDEGYSYGAKVSLVKEYYPTREYEGARLPAGTYLSLKVEIGSAEGKNWWCVLYPPLCTGSAEASEELSEAGFSTNQIKLITDNEDRGYTLKFRIAETLSSVANKLKKLFR